MPAPLGMQAVLTLDAEGLRWGDSGHEHKLARGPGLALLRTRLRSLLFVRALQQPPAHIQVACTVIVDCTDAGGMVHRCEARSEAVSSSAVTRAIDRLIRRSHRSAALKDR